LQETVEFTGKDVQSSSGEFCPKLLFFSVLSVGKTVNYALGKESSSKPSLSKEIKRSIVVVK
jgi:hypothetical protein